MAWWLAAILACVGGPADTGDTGDDPVVDDEDDYEPCEDVEIDWMGPDEPRVGDQWTVWLRCDGATLTGPTVLRFDPSDFASIDGNVATFRQEGTGEMSMQVGGYRETMKVTVLR